MYLQVPRKDFAQKAPPPVGPRQYSYEIQLELEKPEAKPAAEASGVEIDLPILATANDLREVVKFFKHKPQGVSTIEMTNAEPRRVFDARKIAAYEFWGVIGRADERLYLTPLGEELAVNTEAECEIHRRILRSIPAYTSAVEWICRQRLKIATYLDVANFWERSVEKLHLSPQNEENIEAVIVSFFSLCHAAELGTATVGKRGQPARLSIRLDQVKAFLDEKPENAVRAAPQFERETVRRFAPPRGEKLNRVYLSTGRRDAENLRAALELADFESVAFGAENFGGGFLPLARLTAIRECQAALFLLDETDCVGRKDAIRLSCDRITEISVAQALFGDRVVVLWNSAEAPPDLFQTVGLNFFTGAKLDWETNVRLVKCLKSLKR
jgi:hypothetical protein